MPGTGLDVRDTEIKSPFQPIKSCSFALPGINLPSLHAWNTLVTKSQRQGWWLPLHVITGLIRRWHRPGQLRVDDSYFPSSPWDGSWLTSSGPHAPTPATAMYFWRAQCDELFQVSQNMGLPVLKSGQFQANGDDKSFYVLTASQESLTNASMHYAFEGQMQ